jgi:hypothetical protein
MGNFLMAANETLKTEITTVETKPVVKLVLCFNKQIQLQLKRK